MSQKRTTLTTHIKAFRSETLMLLRFFIAFKRIIKFDNYNKISRTEYVDLLIALKALENDMLLRVCKFDDKTRGVHSFHKAELEITEQHPNKIVISEKIKAFSIFIKELKEQRRHQELAHLKIGEADNEYAIKYNLLPAIKLIAEIVDLMAEEKINYSWSDGRYEKYSLRKEILENVDVIKAPMNGFFRNAPLAIVNVLTRSFRTSKLYRAALYTSRLRSGHLASGIPKQVRDDIKQLAPIV